MEFKQFLNAEPQFVLLVGKSSNEKHPGNPEDAFDPPFHYTRKFTQTPYTNLEAAAQAFRSVLIVAKKQIQVTQNKQLGHKDNTDIQPNLHQGISHISIELIKDDKKTHICWWNSTKPFTVGYSNTLSPEMKSYLAS